MLTLEEFFQMVKSGAIEQVKSALDDDPDLAQARATDSVSGVLLAAYYQQPGIARLLIKYGAPVDLFEACAVGLTQHATEILDQQPDLVNAFAPDGFQPLGLACFFGHLEVVELLLARGAQVAQASHNPMQVMPLHSAVAGRNIEIIHRLLAYRAPVNARQADGFTPLHGAAQNGDVEVIRILLEAGADPQASDADSKTALAFAIQEDHTEAIELLRSALSDPRYPANPAPEK